MPLYSESKLHLRYDQSNNDGPIYAPVDAQRLARDELRMRELGRQPIYMSNIEMSASSRGDIHLRFELKPTNAQRRLLGGFVLGSLITKLDDPIWVYTHFWHQVVSSEAAGRQEAMRLNQLLDAPQGSRNANDIARRFYVMQPQIIQRTGDLRSVK